MELEAQSQKWHTSCDGSENARRKIDDRKWMKETVEGYSEIVAEDVFFLICRIEKYLIRKIKTPLIWYSLSAVVKCSTVLTSASEMVSLYNFSMQAIHFSFRFVIFLVCVALLAHLFVSFSRLFERECVFIWMLQRIKSTFTLHYDDGKLVEALAHQSCV